MIHHVYDNHSSIITVLYILAPNSFLVVYTPQRKSGRRLNDEEIIYDDENVSQILLKDPNAAFISNPVIRKSADIEYIYHFPLFSILL